MKRKICVVMAVLALLSFCSCNKDDIIVYDNEKTEITETATTSQKEVVAEFDDFSSENIIAFKDKMSEADFKAAEEFFPVLNNEKSIFHQYTVFNQTVNTTKEKIEIFNDFESFCEKNNFILFYGFTVFDIDNDDVKELILGFNMNYIIIHKENDEFFINTRSSREMQFLQKNGIFGSSGGAACTHYNTLSFENGKFIESEIAYQCANEEFMFCINGKEVSEEEFEAWREEILVGEVEWYTCEE